MNRPNTVMGAYRLAVMDVFRWGDQADLSLFTTTKADPAAFAERSRGAGPLSLDTAPASPKSQALQLKCLWNRIAKLSECVK